MTRAQYAHLASLATACLRAEQDHVAARQRANEFHTRSCDLRKDLCRALNDAGVGHREGVHFGTVTAILHTDPYFIQFVDTLSPTEDQEGGDS